MIVHEVEQGTEEWLALRRGLATASRFKDARAFNKDGTESAARAKYRAELVVERLTGRTPERYRTSAMEFGSETETEARTMYSLNTGNLVDPGPFIQHDTLQAAASPDGLVDADGTIEIKCYELQNHIAALRRGKMPEQHMDQVQGQLWLSGRQWCHFISFAPELPENAQLFIQRIERNNQYIAALELDLRSFLLTVDKEVDFVRQYGGKVAPAAKRMEVSELFN